MLYCLSHKGSLRVQCGIAEADISIVTVMSLSGRVMSRARGLPQGSESRLLAEEEVGQWRVLQAEKVVLSEFDQDGRGPLVRSPVTQGERGHIGGGEINLKSLPFPPHWRMPAGVHCQPELLLGGTECSLLCVACPGLLHVGGGGATPHHALPLLCLDSHTSAPVDPHQLFLALTPQFHCFFPTFSHYAPVALCTPASSYSSRLRMITAHFHRLSHSFTTLWSGSNIIPISQVRKPRPRD